jgi:hypothetical protein
LGGEGATGEREERGGCREGEKARERMHSSLLAKAKSSRNSREGKRGGPPKRGMPLPFIYIVATEEPMALWHAGATNFVCARVLLYFRSYKTVKNITYYSREGK